MQLAGIALASAAVTAAVLLALRPGDGSDDGEPAPSPEAVAKSREPAHRTLVRLRERFAVFRAPHSPVDAPVLGTAGRVGDVDTTFVRANGVDVRDSRLLRRSPRVFAAPGRGTVCLVFQDGGGQCTPARDADRDIQVHTCGSIGRGRYEVSGLVADSTRAVDLVLRDGRRIGLMVRRSFVRRTLSLRRAGDAPRRVETRGHGAVRSDPVPQVTPAGVRCDDGP